ncbi:MAG: hypothetical protein GTN89_07940 [Acidobacteria bacterium]|nr:hypothetical protein [Acidobacteriota bacterium]NIM63673.1 hypothetical protein [Acidobacteriota bacterium]NIO59276.1 hypothetical protein [Acidobacteriota bacterium]NIQ30288.1 hypothetical protein [Acidobacteriota bacterium]NIQ85231.1 hypothetical protein [Acidobacteriota bacterium]
MRDQVDQTPGLLPDLEELCRIHDIGLDLIDRSHDLDDLLDRVLDEYQTRLGDMRPDTLDGEPDDETEAKKLRALVMFASQAAALKEKAVAAEERRRVERLALVMRTLSVLSHKINNPLTTLIGRSQMLRSSAGDPAVVKASEAIEESSKRIASYIKELSAVVREGREESLDRLLDTERPEVECKRG